MADADTAGAATTTSSSSRPLGTLESLQNQANNYSRRLRPPDLDAMAGDENRVPLRAETEKLGRRASKVGLRNIFSRHKTFNEGSGVSSMRELRNIRASLYGFHAAKSDLALPTAAPSPSRPQSTAPKAPSAGQATAGNTAAAVATAAAPITATTIPTPTATNTKPPNNNKRPIPVRSKTPTPAARSGRGSLATWDPPPLFQAYPQAIKHATLPACTTSAEALLRLHGGSKGSISLREGLVLPELAEDYSSSSATERYAADRAARRKHRRNASGSSLRLDWTTKIYVLVTSGYLLQYAGEGSFDRLPEKMLQIGKDSAAFASDLIPGRHWVLQVCSAMDPDGNQGSDSRSLFSRLPFPRPERRHASTFLMVFESAEDMEGWITTLRREIEHLGGKKNLSETGKPRAEAEVVELRAQPSQRTLVVRDPERFSRVISAQDLPWNQDMMMGPSGAAAVVAAAAPDIHLERPGSDTTPDTSFDEASTTNSMISQDGRQLENLRDSLRDSANRLSFISSGQRTMVTSEGSSPPCSPLRDSFASQADDPLPPYLDGPQEAAAARPRPNAAAILDRRQSMQTVNHLVDFRIAPSAPPRPLSTYAAPPSTASWQEDAESARGLGFQASAVFPQTIPNFSVPHSAAKRYSLVKSPPPLETASSFWPTTPANGRSVLARGSRRPPPPSLGSSRPLSIVADQPSPESTSTSPRDYSADEQRNGLSSPGSTSDAPDTPSTYASWGRQNALRPPPPPLPQPVTAIIAPPAVAPPRKKAEDLVPVRRSSLIRNSRGGGSGRNSPRRHSSLQTLRPSEAPSDSTGGTKSRRTPVIVSQPVAPTYLSPLPLSSDDDNDYDDNATTPLPFPHYHHNRHQLLGETIVRSKSSLDSYGRATRSPSPPPPLMRKQSGSRGQHQLYQQHHYQGSLGRRSSMHAHSHHVSASTASASSFDSTTSSRRRSSPPTATPLVHAHHLRAGSLGAASILSSTSTSSSLVLNAALATAPTPTTTTTTTTRPKQQRQQKRRSQNPPAPRPSSSNGHLRATSSSSSCSACSSSAGSASASGFSAPANPRALFNGRRRSMPQLAEGPPPAPPPTCALPPLPPLPLPGGAKLPTAMATAAGALDVENNGGNVAGKMARSRSAVRA